MFKSKRTQVGVFVGVLGLLAGVIYARGFGVQLGGTPAAIAGEFKTEEAWIANEIVRDMTEMSATARGISLQRLHANAHLLRDGVFRVTAPALLKSETELNLLERVWDIDRYAQLAQMMLADVRPARRSTAAPSIQQRLTELTPGRISAASGEISAGLSERMNDPHLHESAALTLGAFALREASGRFHDVRWSLNRMTAHLAMSRALLGSEHPSLDGQLAEAVLLTLANHQARAIAVITRLESSADAVAAVPWTRTLRMRLTQDYALLPEPSRATLVEKFEYLRSRRTVARYSRSVGDFDALNVNPTADVDWVRILEAHPRGVEEASFIAEGLALELERREAQQLAGSDPNRRATRLMTSGRPVIIPAGAWAESSQRHYAMLIGSADAYWRHKLGNNAKAAESAAELDRALAGLTMFAPATTFRTKGKANGDADLTHINDAIRVAISEPERLNSFVWSWLGYASKYEAMRTGMPLGARWFIRPSPRMPYDAVNRLKLVEPSLTADELTALAKEAPFDYGTAVASVEARHGPKGPYEAIQTAFGRRLSYDLRAMDYALERLGDSEGLELREVACAANATHCAGLGAVLARLNRHADAAASYERAFADETFDRVRLANESQWLVQYYQRTGQIDRAMALAAVSAGIGSRPGIITAAHLYEDLRRYDEAQSLYQQVFKRYDDPSQLLGFYYRAVVMRKETQYDTAWRSLAPAVFPQGLQEAPVKLDARPVSGVIVTKDNPNTVKAGIQVGDIIVGLEGFRVENLQQYYAVNAFFSKEQMKLTLWRGNLYTATISAPNRLMGIQFRTHPIEGWAEK